MAWNAVTITGLVLLIAGILLILSGVVVREINISDGVAQPWYMYALLVGGMVVTITGAVLFVVWFDEKRKKDPKIPPVHQRYPF